MDIKPIKAEADYCAALKEIEKLMLARPNSEEGARLEILAGQVEAYERKRHPLDGKIRASSSRAGG